MLYIVYLCMSGIRTQHLVVVYTGLLNIFWLKICTLIVSNQSDRIVFRFFFNLLLLSDYIRILYNYKLLVCKTSMSSLIVIPDLKPHTCNFEIEVYLTAITNEINDKIDGTKTYRVIHCIRAIPIRASKVRLYILHVIVSLVLLSQILTKWHTITTN